jgi:hypothetical protein
MHKGSRREETCNSDKRFVVIMTNTLLSTSVWAVGGLNSRRRRHHRKPANMPNKVGRANSKIGRRTL